MTITVFCASSGKVPDVYFREAETLGKSFSKNGHNVIYGGGAIGLMGRLADTILASGGHITGIIPQFMLDVEWGHRKIHKMVVVDNMHQRKQKFLEGTDAVVSLAGGCGTLEELMETITLKRLGIFTKPIIIVNTDGFYNSLVRLLDHMISEKFMRPEHRTMWTVVENASQVEDAIHNAPPWDESARDIAAV
jgi:uncharacterized protein (TIGR00730 family)